MCQGEHGREAGSEGKGGNDNCARPELRSSCTRDGAQKGGKGECAITTKQENGRARSTISVCAGHCSAAAAGGEGGSERSLLIAPPLTEHQRITAAAPSIILLYISSLYSTFINPYSTSRSLLFSYISSSVSDYDDHFNDKGPRRLPANLFTILFPQDRHLLSFILVLVNPFSRYL